MLYGEVVAFTVMIPVGSNAIKRCCVDLSSSSELPGGNDWQGWRAANYPEDWLEREMMREHRTVVLPAFQGIGIGSLMADCSARLCEEMGYAFQAVTVHPKYGAYRDRSPFWSTLPTNQSDSNVLG